MNEAEVLVIGAGPAGMAAATRAHESGARVALVDDNWSAGGQIWRGTHESHTSAGIQTFWGTQVIDLGSGRHTLWLENTRKRSSSLLTS